VTGISRASDGPDISEARRAQTQGQEMKEVECILKSRNRKLRQVKKR